MKGNRGWIGFAAVLLVTSGAVAVLSAVLSKDPVLVRGLGVSAGLAAVVQYAGFGFTKYLMRRKLHVFAAWGGAMGIRFLSLIAYALIVIKRPDLMLPPAPTLVTFAALLFVTSSVEPLFLNA